MVEADCAAIAQLHDLLDVSSWSEDQWRESCRSSPYAWVLENEEGILGYAIYRALIEQAELLNFGIKKRYQRAGRGEEFLRATMLLLPESTTEVLLEVRQSNTAAIGLYDKIGFNEVAVRENYYSTESNKREDALVLIYSPGGSLSATAN